MTTEEDNRIVESDALRTLSNVHMPDERQAGFVRINKLTGQHYPFALKDFHEDIKQYTLSDSVPIDIRIHFETAKNVYLYSWHVYRFGMVAKMQAIASLEFALRTKAEKEHIKRITPKGKRTRKTEKASLDDLLDLAADKGWISDSDFLHLFIETPKDYVEVLKKTLPSLRNTLAHGSMMLLPPVQALHTFAICQTIINRLFA